MKVYRTEELIEKGKSLHIFASKRCDRPEPTHIHDFIEIIYVKSGEAEECVDGVSYHVRHGDVIFINYGSTHSFTPCGEYAYINICFSPEVVGDAIVTAPVSVADMHAWRAAHPGVFIAAFAPSEL